MQTGDAESGMNELHIRASQWYEDHDLDVEAFRHAAATNDVERAERLAQGKGIPLHLSGGVSPILEWLESLPKSVKDARPSLWWRHGSLLLINGQTMGVEDKLQAAETALATLLKGEEPDTKTRNLIGQIASARATVALTRYDVKTMLIQSNRALEHLAPDQLSTRATANWALGYAHLLQGDRVAARQALTEGIALSQKSKAMFSLILASLGLGNVQEADNELHQAAETYQRVVQWVGDQPQQIIYEAHLGLARVFYEWNELETAERHGRQSLILARQYEQVIDRHILCEVFLARLKLAQGEGARAVEMLAETSQSAFRKNFIYRIPEVVAAQVVAYLHQGELATAEHLAQAHPLPVSQARVLLAQGNPTSAITLLEPVRQQMVEKRWKDEHLKVLVLMAVAHQANGEKEKARQLLGEALTLAEPSGFIRLFVDEGEPVRKLLGRMKDEGGRMKEYIHTLLAAFPEEENVRPASFSGVVNKSQPLIEPLSQREVEVLRLIAEGLSNQEISERLFLALSSVKGHNRNIFDKLQVERRTEAVARARELGLI